MARWPFALEVLQTGRRSMPDIARHVKHVGNLVMKAKYYVPDIARHVMHAGNLNEGKLHYRVTHGLLFRGAMLS
jgi:hypothetical protein